MPLPPDLVTQVNRAARDHGFDANSLLRSLNTLMADDRCNAYRVWSGPGFGQDTLKLDIYVLSEFRLYNLAAYEGDSNIRTSAVFLDSINGVLVTFVPHVSAPYLLTVWGAQQMSQVFAAPDDLQGLEVFQRAIIEQAQIARTRKG